MWRAIAILPVLALAGQHDDTAAAAKAQASEASEVSRAKAAIAQLQAVTAKVHADLKNGSRELLQHAESKVHNEFHQKHEAAQQEWEAKLQAFIPEKLAQAKHSEIHSARHAAEKAEEALEDVEREELKALRKACGEHHREKTNMVGHLGEEADRSARLALDLGQRAADGQRAAGVAGGVYEKAALSSELADEALEAEAERAREGAEQALSEQYDELERLLERCWKELDDAHRTRKLAERKAAQAIVAQDKEQHEGAKPAFFLEDTSNADAKQARTPGKVASAEAAEGNDATNAEDAISQLRAFATKVHTELKNGSRSLLGSVVAKEDDIFQERRTELEEAWKARLAELDPKSLAKANRSELEDALELAEKAEDKLQDLEHEEFKAARKACREQHHESRKWVRHLAEEAQKSARRAMDAGRRAADRQRAAGAAEKVFEGTELRSELASEQLRDRAELAGEDGEQMLEDQLDQLEELLDEHSKRLDQAHRERKRAVQDAKQAIEWARHARKQGENKRAGTQHDSEEKKTQKAPAILFVSSDDRKTKAMVKVASVEEAEVKAADHAKDAVSQLHGFAAKLRDLKGGSRELLASVATTVHEEFKGKRKDAEESWKAELAAVRSASKAEAKQSEIKDALSSAKKAGKKVQELEDEEFKAVRKACREENHKSRKWARHLAEEAQKSARQAMDAGRRAADQQRVAGAAEKDFEGTELRSELTGEQVAEQAELAGEDADRMLGEQLDQLERLFDEHLKQFDHASRERKHALEDAQRPRPEQGTKPKEALSNEQHQEPTEHTGKNTTKEEPAVLLASMPAVAVAEGKAEARAVAAEDEERRAADRAKEEISQLRGFASKIHTELKNGSREFVKSVEADVQQEFQERMQQRHDDWEASFRSFAAVEQTQAKKSEVDDALRIAAKAEDRLRDLEHDELKAVRRASREKLHERRKLVGHLGEEAEKAARKALGAGNKAADRERAAGAAESVYEGTALRSELSNEKLENEAELSCEDAEHMLEKQHDQLARLFEERVKQLDHAHHERKHAERQVRHAVAEARRHPERQRQNRHDEAAGEQGSTPTKKEQPDERKNAKTTEEKEEDEKAKETKKESPAVLLAGMSTFEVAAEHGAKEKAKQAKSEAKEAAADSEQGEATRRAEEAISELHSIGAKARGDVKNGTHELARSMVSAVRDEFHDKHEELKQKWEEALQALNSQPLTTASRTKVEDAVDALESSGDELRDVEREQNEAVRGAFKKMRHEGNSKVHALRKQAQRAVEQATKSGRHAASWERAAGAPEQKYEHAGLRSELANEALGLRAELAGEYAERMMKEKFERLEDDLQQRMEEVENEAIHRHESRRREGRKAKQFLEEARAAARKQASPAHKSGKQEEREPKQHSADPKHQASPAHKSGKQEEREPKQHSADPKHQEDHPHGGAAHKKNGTAATPSVTFLASSVAGSQADWIVPGAFIAGCLAAAGVLGFRARIHASRHVLLEQPILG